MSSRANTIGGRRKRRSQMTYLWIIGLIILVVGLIYFEQTALLYILSTLGVTALLVIVALADLGGTRRDLNEAAPADDAAAIGNGLTATAAPPSTSKPMRGAKRR